MRITITSSVIAVFQFRGNDSPELTSMINASLGILLQLLIAGNIPKGQQMYIFQEVISKRFQRRILQILFWDKLTPLEHKKSCPKATHFFII